MRKKQALKIKRMTIERAEGDKRVMIERDKGVKLITSTWSIGLKGLQASSNWGVAKGVY